MALGFKQQPTSYSGVPGTGADAYTYKMSDPVVFTPLQYGSYAGWWIDRGGFGSTGAGGSGFGVTTVAPFDYELLRLSAVTKAQTRENTLEVFDFTNAGLGSVPGSFFNEAGVSSVYNAMTNPYPIAMYGLNAHTSGCNNTKCGGPPPETDFDIQQIGVEADVEERGGASKQSYPSYGIYSVCVNCNNSGQGVPPNLPNVAFLADARMAIDGPTVTPAAWGVAFQTTAGGALVGLSLGATSKTASDAQAIRQCASTGACTTVNTTQTSLTNISSPGRTQFLLGNSNVLSPVSFAYNENSYKDATMNKALAPSDFGAYWNNTGATSTVTFVLPASPVAGTVIFFTVTAGAGIKVIAASGTQICAVSCVTGYSYSSTTTGSFAKFYASQGNWYVEYSSGTWNYAM